MNDIIKSVSGMSNGSIGVTMSDQGAWMSIIRKPVLGDTVCVIACC